MRDSYDLAVVGAGLSAMSFLRAGGAVGATAVIEYRDRAGGWLQPAFPDPDLAPAEEVIRTFRPPDDVDLLLDATAVGLLPAAAGPHTILVRTREGTQHVRAGRVLIASGGLEITREHDQIPGSRPAGVTTPAFIFQLLNRGYLPGTSAIVYGRSRYAVATAERLSAAGVEAALIPSAGESIQASVPVQPAGEVVEVRGFPRLESVVIRRDGMTDELPADVLVYARGMMANSLWLKGSGVETEPDGRVRVNDRYETNLPGVYAIGTVVEPSLDHERSIEMGEGAARVLRSGDAG